MSEEDLPTLIVLTEEDMERDYESLMVSHPYETIGQLRDAVFDGEQCCPNCYDYTHPYADAWRHAQSWLFLADKDWRTVE